MHIRLYFTFCSCQLLLLIYAAPANGQFRKRNQPACLFTAPPIQIDFLHCEQAIQNMTPWRAHSWTQKQNFGMSQFANNPFHTANWKYGQLHQKVLIKLAEFFAGTCTVQVAVDDESGLIQQATWLAIRELAEDLSLQCAIIDQQGYAYLGKWAPCLPLFCRSRTH